MTDIWAAVGAQAQPRPLTGEILRLVESQEQVATNRLVSHARRAGPARVDARSRASPRCPRAAARLDYLLATPFRYPPLPYGSRFGGRHEPSLFYAARARHHRARRIRVLPLRVLAGDARAAAGAAAHAAHAVRCAAARPARLRAAAPAVRHFPRGAGEPRRLRAHAGSSAEPCAMRAPTPSNTSRRATWRAVSTSRSTRLRPSVSRVRPSRRNGCARPAPQEVSFYARGDAGLRAFPLVAVHGRRSAAGAGGVICACGGAGC